MRTITPTVAKLVPKNAELVYKGKIFDVYQWQQKMFDGSFETFEMLKRPDTIKIIAIKDDKIVILDQKQPDQAKAFIDLPGGRHDQDNESELDAAKRELLEETGMQFGNWRLIDIIQPHNKIEWFVYLFLATDFSSQQAQTLDRGEQITVELTGFEELKALMHSPNARHLPKELLEKCQSIDDLLNLPEYKN